MHKAPSIVLFNLYKHVCGEKIVGTELKAAFGKKCLWYNSACCLVFVEIYLCEKGNQAELTFRILEWKC